MADQVPLIDLTAWYDGGPDDRAAVAAAVDDALCTMGFLLITGHGVPATAREDVRGAARGFFALPDTEKAPLATVPGGRGWIPAGGEYSGGPGTPPDLKESYLVGPAEVTVGNGEGISDLEFFEPNVWPESLPELERSVGPYLAGTRRLADDLLEIFALALDLPVDTFTACARRAPNTLNIVWYPPYEQMGAAQPDQWRVSPHGDFGTLTILDREPGRPGLQVQSRAGEWIDAPWEPDAFTINIGDLMARWTGDRWRATHHRIPAPDPGVPAQELLSLVYFFEVDSDTVVEPLPTAAAGPNRYEPVHAGDYLRERYAEVTA